MAPEQQPPVERLKRKKQREAISMLGLALSAEDAAKALLVRRFAAEVAALYEAYNGKATTELLRVRTPAEAYALLRGEIEGLEHEQMRVINFDSRQQVLSMPLIYQGNINTIIVRAAEVFKPAILHIIIEDVAITRQLVQAGRILDIELLDHLIIGKGRFVSLKERGLGFES